MARQKKSANNPAIDMRLWAIVSILFVFSSYYYMTEFRSQAYQVRWYQCTEFLQKGTLYGGGRSECIQPPMTYLVGLAFRLADVGKMQMFAYILTMILHTCCLFLILRLVKPKRPSLAIALAAAYALILTPQQIDWGSSRGDLATMLACFFMMIGTYILFTHSGLKAVAASSTMLLLALASKASVLSAVAGLFIALMLIVGKKAYDPKKRRILWGPLVKAGATFAAPIAIGVGIMVLIFPNILVYTIFSQIKPAHSTFLQTLFVVVTTNPVGNPDILIFYLLLAAAVAYYIRTGDEVAAAYAVSSFMGTITRGTMYGYFMDSTLESYYVIFPVFFLFIIVGRAACRLPERKMTAMCAIIVVAALFFGGLKPHQGTTFREWSYIQLNGKGNLLNDVEELRSLVDGVYRLLPKNDGPVLADWGMYNILRDADTKTDMAQVDWTSAPQIDLSMDYFTPALLEYGMVDNRNLPYTLNDRETALAQGIEADRYFGTYIGPSQTKTHLWRVLAKADKDKMSEGCTVYLPKFSRMRIGNQVTTFYFRNPKYCIQLGQDAKAYIESVFDRVCSLDEFVATNTLKDTFERNLFKDGRGGYSPPMFGAVCRSGKDVLAELERLEDGSIALKIPAMIALAGAAAIVLRDPKRKRTG
ncbi:MAG: hypothetical protein V1875_06165 [Candidatus Altiarchaeota archaeon]